MDDHGQKDFRHPYRPYDVQHELMQAIYDTIKEGKVGVFESPTGTGKSLSLICSSLTWLREHQEGILVQDPGVATSEGLPSWAVEQALQQRRKEANVGKISFEKRLQEIRAKERRNRQSHPESQRAVKRQKVSPSAVQTDHDNLAQFELEDYDSDSAAERVSMAGNDINHGLSTNSIQLMEKLGLIFKPTDDEESPLDDQTKILYSSRTHSQLTQFVQELRRVTPKEPSWLNEVRGAEHAGLDETPNIRHIPLGSRKNLCINPQVRKLGSVNAINEKCIELQQPDTKRDARCPFLPSQDNDSQVSEFRDQTMAKVIDIEDLGHMGREHGICPYYASRSAIKPSEIVTLPYPLLLQKSAREALDLSLKDHVVVIDEAHNLMEVISNIYSCSITLSQVQMCRHSIAVYLQKFRNRLKGKNRVYIAQLIRLLDSLAGFMQAKTSASDSIDGSISLSELMAGKGADQINLHALMRYLHESKLARKVEGYFLYQDQQDPEKDPLKAVAAKKPSTTPTLTHVQTFLSVLTNPAAEGRFFFEKNGLNGISLKYLLLDPINHFKEIVDEARAVILAGGTMSPLDDYVQQLFPYLEPDRLKTWGCGHIISKENLLAIAVNSAHDGTLFDFTYNNRNSSRLIEALGHSVLRLSAAVPDGLVAFFPSYAYLERIVSAWKSDEYNGVWRRLEAIKPIFQESKSANVDELLESYASSIDKSRGGLMLAVVGGKLSEGINFSDKLGRAVIVVGLPFPNIQSAQWKAKLEYIEQSVLRRTGRADESKQASRNYYENSCMRAVNQSIGRAIRHKGDYAAIVLLDKRYASPRISRKLPEWIQTSLLDESQSVESSVERLDIFFQSRSAVS